MYIQTLGNADTVRVTTNPKALQLTLFPLEEIEYCSVNFGVFQGDCRAGRVAVSCHYRNRKS
ncbi:MAG: hypothetical protein LBF88_03285 [Planctomycetaceae bacterium]|jgi:hypothetical protein|nr:hypothetical protein [Planctomycetaceae bacterium]